MLRRFAATLLLALALPAVAFQPPALKVSELPVEARETLRLIDSSGPFLYKRDGIVFQNREQRLPEQGRGYYREYTVETPGLSHRGARRIVTGGRAPAEYYYTADHYKSFRRIDR